MGSVLRATACVAMAAWASVATLGSSATLVVTTPPAGLAPLVITLPYANRLRGVHADTNLLQSTQDRTLVLPEQTGTAPSLTLTVTDTLPTANNWTGVRLP